MVWIQAIGLVALLVETLVIVYDFTDVERMSRPYRDQKEKL